MRKLAQTTTALLIGSTGAVFAAGPDTGAPEARAYFRLDVHNVFQRAVDFQYGLTMDYRSPTQAAHVPMAQFNFDRKGFLNAWLNGLPVAQTVQLNQSEGDVPVRYTAVDWSLLVAGVVGVGAGAAAIADGEDSPTVASPSAASPSPVSAPMAMGFGQTAGITITPEHQAWLDSGTGQMGDLLPITD